MTTCGDWGGVTQKGEPCKRTAGWGVPDTDEGRCKTHLEQVPEPETYTAPLGWTYAVTVEGTFTAATAVTLTPSKAAAPVEPEPPEEPVEPEPPEDPEPPEEPEPPIIVDPEPPYEPSDRHPHQPEWATRVFFDHGEWDYWPELREGIAGFPAARKGHVQFNGVNASPLQYGITPDASTPQGYAGYVRALWNAGRRVGTGMWNWTARGGEGDPWPFALKRWYVSFWSYLEPEPDGMWETNFDQLRMFSTNRHLSSTLATFTYRGVLRYEGTSVRWETGEPKRMAELRAYRHIGRRCDGCSTTTIASSDPGMPLGQWVNHELIYDRTVKTSGPLFSKGDDGVGPLRLIHRINGEVRTDRVLENIYMEAPFAELHVNFNQSGGISPTVDRYIRFTGMYISGEAA
jgi:hypothetical protein